MASYRILYWQDLPAQLRVWDDVDELTVELPAPFQARIDAAAQAKGLTGTDAYLDQWHWGDDLIREGAARQVAAALQAELEAARP
jgi:hypothetical protein